MCRALANSPRRRRRRRLRRQQPNPSTPLHAPTISREAFPSVLWFLIPKGVSGSADTTGIRALPCCALPAPPPPLHPTPAPHPPTPCLLVHMQRKEASPLWQQQNTTLQKRCAPLTVTIKKGVDRIRAGDDDLRGRDVQKDARREEKGLSFLCLLFFFHTFFFFFFFIFPGFIKPHLTHV